MSDYDFSLLISSLTKLTFYQKEVIKQALIELSPNCAHTLSEEEVDFIQSVLEESQNIKS